MGKKLLSFLIVASMLVSVIPAHGEDYLPGGQQIFEDFESSGDYKSSAYKIGIARTAKATPSTASTYLLSDFPGLIIHKGDNTLTGTYYDYTKEGPDANLIVEYDIYFDDLVETGSTFRLRLRDLDEYQKTNILDITFSATTINTGKGTYDYQLQDDHWYHMRLVFKGTNSSGSAVRKYDLYIDGVAVITNGGLASSSTYKFPRVDTLYLSLIAASSAIDTTAYMDNVSIYKANSTAPMPVNNSGLLTEIRNAEALKNQAVFGTGEEEYASELEAAMEEALYAAKDVYESSEDEAELTQAQLTLKSFCETFAPNGKNIDVGDAAFYDADTDQPVITLAGISTVRAEIPVSISRFAEQDGKKVTAYILATSKNQDGSDKVEAISAQVQEVLTPDPEGKVRVEYTLEPTLDVSAVSSGATLKAVVIEDGKNPVPYYLYNDGSAISDEFNVVFASVYDEDTSILKFTAETVAEDNVLLTVYNGDSLLYVNQCIADENGVTTFVADTSAITEEATLQYYMYSTAAGNLKQDSCKVLPVVQINTVLNNIYILDQSAAEAIVVNESALLGLNQGFMGLYSSNGLVASEAVAELKKKQYTAQELQEVQDIVLEYSKKYAMNYLQTDSLLEEILDEKQRNTVAPIIGIGSDKDTFGEKSAGRYQDYIKMEDDEKKAVYDFIRQKQDYLPEEHKTIFENAVVIAQVNTAVSNDKIISAITNNDDLLTNAAAFLDLSGSKQRTAAGIILSHGEFDSVSELDSYINTAVEEAKDTSSGSSQGSFGGSSGSSGGGFGGSGGSSGRGSSVGGILNAPIEKPDTDNNDAAAGTVAEIKFVDLKNHEWAMDAISFLQKKGVINGKGNNLFAPNDLVTREEFVKMVTLLFGITSDSDTCVFEDVNADAWYSPYVISAYENGIVNGVSDTRFGVGQQLTREQMVTMAYNAAVKAGVSFNESAHYVPFSDDDSVDEYAEKPLHILAGNGIINGKDENLFMPKAVCTRAEAAKVLHGIYLANYR